MSTPTPEDTDRYLADLFVGADPTLDAAVAAQRAAGMPAIEVAPVAGKFLNLIARIAGARRVLEIGTLGGYSTIWLARAVGDGGSVTTIEAERAHAEVARANLDRAGVSGRVEIVVGRGSDVLPRLSPAFDLVFIDADKESNAFYLEQAARLTRPGSVVILDNVGRAGRIADASVTDSMTVGTREGLRMLAEDPRFDATALQTVGAKGWDGVAVALRV